MELQEIARDVYVCLQEDRGLGCSNSGLLNRDGGLVVDTFWDLPHTRELMAQYARVWQAPARRVVNTHHNGDHCWGNQLFAGAEIIGHRLCAEMMKKESAAVLQALRGAADNPDPAIAAFATALQAFDFDGVVLTPPTTLIDDRLSLDLGGIRAELIYVGPAHTAGDVIVHLPAERIVFTGDVLFRLCTPIGWEGTTERWCGALDEIVALDPAVVVPGHGPLCGVEGPREMKAYLEYIRDESKHFFDQGVSVLDASKRIDPGPYAGWTEPERIVFNVARAYREFQGQEWDAHFDMMELFRGIHEVRMLRHGH